MEIEGIIKKLYIKISELVEELEKPSEHSCLFS